MKTSIKAALFCLFFSVLLKADNRIVFYLKDAPMQAVSLVRMDLEKERGLAKIDKISKKTPSQISRKFVKGEMKKHLMPKLGGFVALYGGYIDYSNIDGLISFPLRHVEPKLYLAITPKIKLVKVKGETVSHLEFEDSKRTPMKIYLFEKKEDENKVFFWKVSEQEIPQDRRINDLSVILLTKPKNIYVATGDFISNDSKHIILPQNIYVTGVIGNNKILLDLLNIKRYFEQIEVEEEKVNDLIYKKMIINRWFVLFFQ